MKKILIISAIIIVAALLFVLSQSTKTNKPLAKVTNNQKTEKSQNLNWEDFQIQAELENTVVIDIRTAGEYNAGKLFSDAVVDFDYYESDFEQKISELDKDKTYLIYCRSGSRTGKSLKIFEKYGLTAYHLDGGHKSTPAGSLK
ncbi:MAG: rhodanese-like domain-containing protein [Candidatus Pacebacteria bacterium]|nr:rhodanese-like domain-containing protein [Candidatus Paceibacterota bacterium]